MTTDEPTTSASGELFLGGLINHVAPVGLGWVDWLHILAETAQHAGHADIVRETLDGAKSRG